MNLDEYRIMAMVEASHWWYRTLRGAVALVLPWLPHRPKILDAGCGTGGTLEWLARSVDASDLEGFDLSDEATRVAKEKIPQAYIYRILQALVFGSTVMTLLRVLMSCAYRVYRLHGQACVYWQNA